MKSSRFSLPRSVMFTRRTATVTISAPLASTAALVSAKSRYLPVPTIRREWNFIPPNSNGVSCIFYFLPPCGRRLTAADEVDYLDMVARPYNSLIVTGFGHDLVVELDGHAHPAHVQAFQQGSQGSVGVEWVRVAIECD